MKDYWLMVLIPVGMLVLAYRHDVDMLYYLPAGFFIGIGITPIIERILKR